MFFVGDKVVFGGDMRRNWKGKKGKGFISAVKGCAMGAMNGQRIDVWCRGLGVVKWVCECAKLRRVVKGPKVHE